MPVKCGHMLTGTQASILFPCQHLYTLSEASSQHKLLVSKNSQGPPEVWEASSERDHGLCPCYVHSQNTCTQSIFFPVIFFSALNQLPEVSIGHPHPGPSAFTPHTMAPTVGVFPSHFPSRPHKGDPFQLLLTAPLLTFRSSLLPWGQNWLKEENKKNTPGGCLERLKANPTVVWCCLFW